MTFIFVLRTEELKICQLFIDGLKNRAEEDSNIFIAVDLTDMNEKQSTL